MKFSLNRHLMRLPMANHQGNLYYSNILAINKTLAIAMSRAEKVNFSLRSLIIHFYSVPFKKFYIDMLVFKLTRKLIINILSEYIYW